MTEATVSSVVEDGSVGSGTSEARRGSKGKGKQSKCVPVSVFMLASAEGDWLDGGGCRVRTTRRMRTGRWDGRRLRRRGRFQRGLRECCFFVSLGGTDWDDRSVKKAPVIVIDDDDEEEEEEEEATPAPRRDARARYVPTPFLFRVDLTNDE